MIFAIFLTYRILINGELSITPNQTIGHATAASAISIRGIDIKHKRTNGLALYDRGGVGLRSEDGVVVIVVDDLEVDRDAGVEGRRALVDGQDGQVDPGLLLSVNGHQEGQLTC